MLGYSAKETAATLETSVASVNSALQRARATIDAEPSRPDPAGHRAAELGDDDIKEVIDAYVDAWDRQDIDGVVGMLTEDAVFSMPPMAAWYGGDGGPRRCAFIESARSRATGSGAISCTTANGQPALAFYAWHEARRPTCPSRSTC